MTGFTAPKFKTQWFQATENSSKDTPKQESLDSSVRWLEDAKQQGNSRHDLQLFQASLT